MNLNSVAMIILAILCFLVSGLIAFRTKWHPIAAIFIGTFIIASIQTIVQAILFGVGPMLLLVFFWSAIPALVVASIVIPIVRTMRRRHFK